MEHRQNENFPIEFDWIDSLFFGKGTEVIKHCKGNDTSFVGSKYNELAGKVVIHELST